MSSSARAGISACVITLNEADRIEACLASLAFCDEIVVVDSGSSDGTGELAAARGAVVLHRPFDGYRTQKEFAVRAARHDWVLCLDADERVTAALRTSIEAARTAGLPAANAADIVPPAQQAKQLLNESAVAVLGLRAFLFTLKLEHCYSAEELRGILPEYERVVTKAKGEAFATAMVRRVETLLARG